MKRVDRPGGIGFRYYRVRGTGFVPAVHVCPGLVLEEELTGRYKFFHSLSDIDTLN